MPLLLHVTYPKQILQEGQYKALPDHVTKVVAVLMHDTDHYAMMEIDILMKKVADKYKHLAIHSVWLIEKSKENGGFQVWHRDFWLGYKVASTIVVNVGAIMRN
jgi:hypothetical protein